MPKEIGVYQENSTCFDRIYIEHILSEFKHLEYIKKKIFSDMKLVEYDSETGIMTEI